jgi:histidine ammonia-lyase
MDITGQSEKKNIKYPLDLFNRILFGGEKLVLEDDSLNIVKKSYHFLEEFSKDKLIYGITTGFGPMAQYRISDEDRIQLQYNLIRSHCSGAGRQIDPICVKAAMICRLVNILQGKSGIHPESAFLLRDFINNDIIPVVYEHGGVGASGDLVQLSHIALAMIGEGEVNYNGKMMPSIEAMNACNLKPISIYIREGLSLINGTSMMTGISIVNLFYAQKLFDWALMASSLINELVDSYDDGFSKELNSVKLHEGQNFVAAMMRSTLEGSDLVRKRENGLYKRVVSEKIIKEKVQEFYSLRCVPQILGPVYDTLKSVEKIVVDEANSCNDNPVVDVETQSVYHGGNFHGDYISLEMDKLKIVVTKMTMLMERQLNFMLNTRINEKFAPFVNLGVLGLNLGMQGSQFTATSTTAECQTLSFPNYIHSIPNNNDNQDIVSMGTNSALIAQKVIENSYDVLSIYYIALIQGIDNIKVQDGLSPKTSKIYAKLRELVPAFKEDTTKYKEIDLIRKYLMSNSVSSIIN